MSRSPHGGRAGGEDRLRQDERTAARRRCQRPAHERAGEPRGAASSGRPSLRRVASSAWMPLPDLPESTRAASFRIFSPPLGTLCCVVALLVLVWIDWAIAGGVFVAGVILLRSGQPFDDDEFVEYAERYGVAEDPPPK